MERVARKTIVDENVFKNILIFWNLKRTMFQNN